MDHPTILKGLCRRLYPKVIPFLVAALLTTGCTRAKKPSSPIPLPDYLSFTPVAVHCDTQFPLIRDYVLANSREPFQMVAGLAQENQTIMIGEKHSNDAARIFMAEAIPFLKQNGVKYLGLEIDSKYQKYMDDFLATGNTETLLFQENGFNEAYLQILQSAKDNGLDVLCIDTDAQNRDGFMFEKLYSEIFYENPDAKVAVYIGKGHIRENMDVLYPWLGDLLDEYTNRKNSSVAVVRPCKYGISWECDITGIPTGIGFLTDQSQISEKIYSTGIMGVTPSETYGSQYDAMVVAGTCR